MSDSHFLSLYPSLNLQRPVGATLGEAMEHLLDQALSHQYPKHPLFGQEIRGGRDLRQVLEECQRAAADPENRVFIEDRAVRQKLRNICNPLELAQMAETHLVLGAYWKNHFNRLLAQSGQTNPTVADLKRWTDQPEERGLPKEIQNLLILIYADQTNRSFVRYGSNYLPTLDDMPSDLELVQAALPDPKQWETTLLRASEIFGISVSRLLNAANLADLGAKYHNAISTLKADCISLPDRLQLVLKNLGMPESDLEQANRIKTARAVRKLLIESDGKEPGVLVGIVAQAQVETSGGAMGTSFRSASAVMKCLRDTKWDLFTAVAKLGGEQKTQAELLLADVRSALAHDELALAGGLASKLSDAESRAIKLLTPGITPPPPPPPPPLEKGWKTVRKRAKQRLSQSESLSEVKELVQRLEQNPKLRLSIDWTLEEETE
jgi:hypothetical protein